MTAKLDMTDSKILAILDADSRTPASKIAKRLKISRQVAEYRINQLVNRGIILNFTTIVDPTKFFDNIWHVYLKLQNLNPEIEKQLLDYLASKDEVWWIAKCQGEWDMIFSVIGNDITGFDMLFSEFRSRFHNIINEHHTTSLIKTSMFTRGYFTGESRARKEYISSRTRPKIDSKDILILKMLATDSRMPATKIAEKTKLSSRQIIYRIKNLLDKGIIRAFRLHLNFNALGYDYYKVCFHAQDFTEKTENSILSWCEMNPNTVYYVKKIAPWSFEIEFETKDYKELNNILKELRNKFGDFIKRAETTLITEEFKGELNILTRLISSIEQLPF